MPRAFLLGFASYHLTKWCHATPCFLFLFYTLLTADGSQRAWLPIPPTATLPPCLWSDLPISPRFSPYEILSRCKFSSLTPRQPIVEFYLLTFSRFPLRKPEIQILVFTRIELTTSALLDRCTWLPSRPLGRRGCIVYRMVAHRTAPYKYDIIPYLVHSSFVLECHGLKKRGDKMCHILVASPSNSPSSCAGCPRYAPCVSRILPYLSPGTAMARRWPGQGRQVVRHQQGGFADPAAIHRNLLLHGGVVSQGIGPVGSSRLLSSFLFPLSPHFPLVWTRAFFVSFVPALPPTAARRCFHVWIRSVTRRDATLPRSCY